MNMNELLTKHPKPKPQMKPKMCTSSAVCTNKQLTDKRSSSPLTAGHKQAQSAQSTEAFPKL